MRALFITVAPPWPANHALRIAHGRYLRALAEVADVTLVTWAMPETTDADLGVLRGMTPDVVVLARRSVSLGLGARIRRRLAFLAGGPPPYAQAMLAERMGSIDELHAAVAARHADEPFGVVVLTEELLGLLPLPDLGAPIVLHRWNVFRNLAGGLDGDRHVGRTIARIEARGWHRYDRAVMAPANLVVVPTPEVASILERVDGSARVVAIPHGVECDPPPSVPPGGSDVAFIGAMDYRANEEAVEWFTRNCWPSVRLAVPDATFRIIGRSPTDRVRALAGDGVQVTGEVADIPAACEGVRVGVVPVRAGMGIKTKTLELMAMGVPVVSTPSGAEGIEALPADGLIVAHSADVMAAAVTALLLDPPRAGALGASARRYVEEHHSWATAAEAYQRELRALVTPGTAAREEARA